MNDARWQNVTAARHAWTAGATRAGDSPLQAYLEVSARCNLRCTMCAINYDSRYKPAGGRPPFFEPELFERLRPIFPTLLRGYLFGLGEPLLNPHLIDYIRAMSECGVDAQFNTNATLIDEAKADEIARAGACAVTVSIDGATAETYESIRRGAKFDRVVRGLRALTAASRRYGKPQINLSIVAMRSNIHELPLLADLAADLGVRTLHVEPLLRQIEGTPLDDHYERENLGVATRVREAFDLAMAKARAAGIHFSSRFANERTHFDFLEAARHLTIDWTCSEPWSTVWITSAGEVRTCCLNETCFGNLHEQTFEEIWNGEAFTRFRAQHARRETAQGCANCIANGRVQSSPYFRATQAVTYRPILEALPRDCGDGAMRLDGPCEGDTVGEPFVVRGELARWIRPEKVEVWLDREPVANVGTARFAGRTITRRAFTLEVPVHFLTEGAHILWMRHRDGRAYAHREIHFRRATTTRVS
jgi:radical SAM protein with 4Fe4S-binding SPASM domain